MGRVKMTKKTAELKNKLENMISKTGKLNTEEALELSRQLDQCILEYYKQYKKWVILSNTRGLRITKNLELEIKLNWFTNLALFLCWKSH